MSESVKFEKTWADEKLELQQQIAALTTERDKLSQENAELREAVGLPERAEQMFDRLLDRIVDAEGKLAYIRRYWDAFASLPSDEVHPQERLALDLCLTQVFYTPETIPQPPAAPGQDVQGDDYDVSN